MSNAPQIRPEWIPEAYRELDSEKDTQSPAVENKLEEDETPPEPPIKTT